MVIFSFLLILFIIHFFTHPTFSEWAFTRHQNMLSWFIRPWFMIPFCYFAYKKSMTGMMATLFALATSMFWFPEPSIADPNIQSFLEFEKKWLQGGWNLTTILFSLSIPLSLMLIALAFWKKSLLWGLILINSVALAKIAWSVFYDGSTGWTVIPFALSGMIVCTIAILYFYKNHLRT